MRKDIFQLIIDSVALVILCFILCLQSYNPELGCMTIPTALIGVTILLSIIQKTKLCPNREAGLALDIFAVLFLLGAISIMAVILLA